LNHSTALACDTIVTFRVEGTADPATPDPRGPRPVHPAFPAPAAPAAVSPLVADLPLAYLWCMDERIRAVTDLMVPSAREDTGLHARYDGVVQDLSPAGVAAGLARLRQPDPDGDPPAAGQGGLDAHDEAHLAAFEARLRVALGELQLHRRHPTLHMEQLDLACYDRDYAPAAERAAARARHLAAWPDAVDAAVEALDQVSAPTAAALLASVEGLAEGLPATAETDTADGGVTEQVLQAARAAHERLVAHVRGCAERGHPDPALGGAELAKLLGSGEAMDVDLGRLEETADAERDRLRERLAETCAELQPGVPPADVVARLAADHPDADGVLGEARAQVAETIAFTVERDLVPGLDGECRVEPSPRSRRHAVAMLVWAGPYEPDTPSVYYLTPPEPTWPAEEQGAWLEMFSRAQLPAITAHEVAPGHFAHSRALRRARGDVRRTLMSTAFVEGWAHYTEELCVEEGFRAGDPRFAVGVWTEALTRVTRLAVSLGVHRRTMPTAEAVVRFEQDAFLRGPAARAEAMRATWDPTYGRYTLGKLEVMRLRELARNGWGPGFSLARFHSALLALGSPPLGLASAALQEGSRDTA
jgi:hypothetical protein